MNNKKRKVANLSTFGPIFTNPFAGPFSQSNNIGSLLDSIPITPKRGFVAWVRKAIPKSSAVGLWYRERPWEPPEVAEHTQPAGGAASIILDAARSSHGTD